METPETAKRSLAQICESDPRFAAFLSAPHKDALGLDNDVLLPRSRGFGPKDVQDLTTLACAVKYDYTLPKNRGRKRLLPLHALHALIRLGPAALPAARALTERCLLTRDEAPAKHLQDDDHYVTEHLLGALSGAFLAMGKVASESWRGSPR